MEKGPRCVFCPAGEIAPPEVIYKKLGNALEPDPKKAGKFKITDHEHLADLWDMAGEFFDK